MYESPKVAKKAAIGTHETATIAAQTAAAIAFCVEFFGGRLIISVSNILLNHWLSDNIPELPLNEYFLVMFSEKDPIIARSSAPGRGGIGVVRISGSKEHVSYISHVLFPQKSLQPRQAHLLALKDADGSLIDRAIVIHFQTPASYTGEDVLEIQAHGGPALQQMILERCLNAGKKVGLRTAEPGEFTKRAYLNNRMDLAQAEAVADLIEANSSAAVRAAARSLQGEFSKRIHAINSDLVELRAYIEATIDFPEEEIDFIETGHVNERVNSILEKLTLLQNAAMRGKVLREGLTVVLAGAPNVGKSSLMNALACEDVAIVTEVAGTTRDRIAHTIHLDGLAVNLIDTAGVRRTDDKVEQIGIERTLQSVENADIVLLLKSADQRESEAEAEALSLILPRLREGVQFLHVFNKIDLLGSVSPSDEKSICLSAKTGQGIDELVGRLKTIAGESESEEGDFLARTRHLDCLARAAEHIQIISGNVVGRSIGLDIAAEELRLAGNALGEIVGETTPDNLLGLIFSKFCIGK